MTTEYKESKRRALDEKLSGLAQRLNELQSELRAIIGEVVEVQTDLASLDEAQA